MDKLFIMGFIFVFTGAVIIASGGIFLGLDQKNLSERKKSLTIVVGAILIAIGGIFTTYGWNCFNQHSQLKSVLTTVALEWEWNDAIIKRDPLFNAVDETALGSHQLYPRFKMGALNSAFISGLFDSSNKKDKEFLRNIADQIESIEDINSRLDFNDRIVTSTLDIKALVNLRRITIGSKGYQDFVTRHRIFEKKLKDNYAWALPAKFLE